MIHKNREPVFSNTTIQTMGQYPSENKAEPFCARYAPCKATHTIGKWDNKAGEFTGEMYVNGENPFSAKSGLDVGGKFMLYDSHGLVGKFTPVYSYRMEGDESVDTMSWDGHFEILGAVYSWNGRCVWELSQFISDMMEFRFFVVDDDGTKPETIARVEVIIHEALQDKMNAYML